MPGGEPPAAGLIIGRQEPHLAQQAADRRPRRGVEQKVVALGDDQGNTGRHRYRARDRFLDRTSELRGVDGGCLGCAQPAKQRDVAGRV